MAKIDRIVDGNIEVIHEHEITAYAKEDDQMGVVTYEIRIGDHRVVLSDEELANLTRAFYNASFGFDLNHEDEDDE